MNKSRIWVFTLLIIVCLMLVFILVKAMLKSEDNITKSEIINIFNSNREKFDVVQKYAESMNGNLYVDISDKRRDINEQNYSKEIVYIIKDLSFVGIYEDEENNTIRFTIQGDTYEQGIMYIKSNIKPDVSPAMGRCEKITDNWFYYLETHV